MKKVPKTDVNSLVDNSLCHRESQITLELPLPPQGLHPNGRVDWRKRSRLVKKARGDAALVAKMALDKSCPWELAIVHVKYFMPRRRDFDGLVSWSKAYFDGLQDAGVVKNDSALRMGRIEQVTGKDAGRKVVLVIEKGGDQC